MKIVVTGGSGFIGSSICIKIKKKYPDYSIVAFDNLKRRGSEINLIEFKKLGIEFIHGDIRNVEDLDILEKFDFLIEASAEPSVLSGINSNPRYVINNNLFGSINCFNVCLKFNAKLIFLSTSRVYPIEKIEHANFVEEISRFSFSEIQTEKGITKFGISEELSLSGSRSFYGTTKLSSELFIEEYSSFYGLEASILRCSIVAGPRQMGKTDQGVVTLWLANHYWKKNLNYIGYGGAGKQLRDILHIDDLTDLIDFQIHNFHLFDCKIFNVGGGLKNSVSLFEMTQLCEDITGNKINVGSIQETRPADLKIFIADTRKINKDINWCPNKNIEDIFNDIFLWINKNEQILKTYFQ